MKNFRVRHGHYNSINFLEPFSLGSSKYLLDLLLRDNRTLLTGPLVYSQNSS